MLGNKKIQIAQCNNNFDKKQNHVSQGLNWEGPFVVMYNEKKINK
mgnify:FL=1